MRCCYSFLVIHFFFGIQVSSSTWKYFIITDLITYHFELHQNLSRNRFFCTHSIKTDRSYQKDRRWLCHSPMYIERPKSALWWISLRFDIQETHPKRFRSTSLLRFCPRERRFASVVMSTIVAGPSSCCTSKHRSTITSASSAITPRTSPRSPNYKIILSKYIFGAKPVTGRLLHIKD